MKTAISSPFANEPAETATLRALPLHRLRDLSIIVGRALDRHARFPHRHSVREQLTHGACLIHDELGRREENRRNSIPIPRVCSLCGSQSVAFNGACFSCDRPD